MVAMTEEFAERTGRSYRQTNNLIPRAIAARCRDADLYASADLVVTSRLHGLHHCAGDGAAGVGGIGEPQGGIIMQAAGLGEWCAI